ncbi:MAG: ABC transporter ATP-binding protein, partial [Streptomyces sp.]|nr:ABC transporter ATP-binding protein [Streptomyces sp.]
RISDIAHDTDVRLWELSPHQASLEEAYMRMTQGAVDYRSTIDQKAGLMQPLPPGTQPPMPVPGQGQPGWYAPPPPQQGGQPFTGPQGQAQTGPYGGPGTGTPNPYVQAGPAAPQGQAQPPFQPPAAPLSAAPPGAFPAAPAPQPQASAQSAAPAPQASAPATPTKPEDVR